MSLFVFLSPQSTLYFIVIVKCGQKYIINTMVNTLYIFFTLDYEDFYTVELLSKLLYPRGFSNGGVFIKYFEVRRGYGMGYYDRVLRT